MKSKVVSAAIILLSAAVPLSYNACSGPNTERTNQETSFGNPVTSEISFSPFAPKGERNVIEFCVSSLKYYSESGSTLTSTSALPKYIPVSHLGNMFTTSQLSAGVYTKVEVSLKDECNKNASAKIENGFGTFNTTDPITLSFTGRENFGQTGVRFDLVIQRFTDAVSIISSPLAIAPGLRDVTGTFATAQSGWRSVSPLNGPGIRALHSGIWTGGQMIIWGGADDRTDVNTGASYNPKEDSWTQLNVVNAPAARTDHSAVWTGNQMVVWGGRVNNQVSQVAVNSGGLYDVSADSWTPMTTTGAPSARRIFTMVWTGKYVLIWGGIDSNHAALGNGGRYDPSTNSWLPISSANSPGVRDDYSAQWTGKYMIVWGGLGDSGDFGSAKTYDPNLDIWADLPVSPVPSGSGFFSAWTGTHFLIWGGNINGQSTNLGGTYDSARNLWSLMPTTGAPEARVAPAGVWTGNSFLVWSGARDYTRETFYDNGYQYFLDSNTWTNITDEGQPEGRYRTPAVWTGSEMIVWGGTTSRREALGNGGRYTPIQ